jgi:hypothetical protein
MKLQDVCLDEKNHRYFISSLRRGVFHFQFSAATVFWMFLDISSSLFQIEAISFKVFPNLAARGC